jgi:hypothetical protein
MGQLVKREVIYALFYRCQGEIYDDGMTTVHMPGGDELGQLVAVVVAAGQVM